MFHPRANSGVVETERIILRTGDVLLSNNPLLRITSPANTDIHSFIMRARKYAGESTGTEMVRKFNEFVKEELGKEPKWYYEITEHVVNLSKAIHAKKGQCKEKAAALLVILESKGIVGYFVGGRSTNQTTTDPDALHTWVEVVVDGRTYIADPSYGVFGEKSEIKQQYGYTPCTIRIYRQPAAP